MSRNDIVDKVRERYGSIAEGNSTGCCGAESDVAAAIAPALPRPSPASRRISRTSRPGGLNGVPASVPASTRAPAPMAVRIPSTWKRKVSM